MTDQSVAARADNPQTSLSAPLELLLTQAALGAAPPALSIGTTARFVQSLASRPGRGGTRRLTRRRGRPERARSVRGHPS